MVRARSWALMPVVVPSRASTLTQKAVSKGLVFSRTIRGIWRRSSREPSRAEQMRPRP